MAQLVYIIVGWLLGLLSQPIASRAEKYFKRKDLTTLIDAESRALIFRLAMVSNRLQQHLGNLDKPSLEWMRRICTQYGKDCSTDFIKSLDKLLEASAEQINTLANYIEAPRDIGISLKPFPPPFKDSALQQLWVFNSTTQEYLLDLKSQIAILNDEIENAKYYFRLTFDSSTMATNSIRIEQNLRDCYEHVHRKCRFISDRIEKYLSRGEGRISEA